MSYISTADSMVLYHHSNWPDGSGKHRMQYRKMGDSPNLLYKPMR